MMADTAWSTRPVFERDKVIIWRNLRHKLQGKPQMNTTAQEIHQNDRVAQAKFRALGPLFWIKASTSSEQTLMERDFGWANAIAAFRFPGHSSTISSFAGSQHHDREARQPYQRGHDRCPISLSNGSAWLDGDALFEWVLLPLRRRW